MQCLINKKGQYIQISTGKYNQITKINIQRFINHTTSKNMKFTRFRIILLLIVLALTVTGSPQVFYKNSGTSKSIGKVNNGSIENAWLIPRKGENFKYSGWFGYYVLGRAYTHSDIYTAILDSYGELEKLTPGIKYMYMEAAGKNGGRLWPHKTHQNGMSVDFMTPLEKNGKQKLLYDRIGMFRYLMNFDKSGKANINSKVSIDFELVALHILTLEKHARKNNLRIKKVILSTHLRDDLFKTKYGQQLKNSGIYFTRNLTPKLNKLHDDHYHIDFEKI